MHSVTSLPPNKGTLHPGTDADIVVFDPNETYTIDASENVSVADYSIYERPNVCAGFRHIARTRNG